MRIEISNTINIQDPSPAVKAWCKENLILPNPEYAKKLQMGLWVGKTPPNISLYETDGNVWKLPYGTLRHILALKDSDTEVTTAFVPAQLIDYNGTDVPLYDYQNEAVWVMFEARYGILQSAAGSGKTQMGIALVKMWGRRALWLTHTADLLTQSMERAALYMDRDQLGTITAGQVNIGTGITFATVQTMCKLDLTQYRDVWDVIIVDECHHVSGSPTRLTQFYKVLNSLRARHKYGLSATVHRSDGLIAATHAILGETVYTVPDEAVAGKILQVTVCPVITPTYESDDYLLPDGMISYVQLVNYLTLQPDRNQMIIEQIIGGWEHPSLILSHRLEHLQTLIDMLPYNLREQAVMVTGKMTSKVGKAYREQAIEDMRNGKKRYLFATYALAKEGLDIPCLERLYLTTPVKDEAVVIQSVGRIARAYPGKQEPIALDYVDRNIRFCQKAWKERLRHYHKIGANII